MVIFLYLLLTVVIPRHKDEFSFVFCQKFTILSFKIKFLVFMFFNKKKKFKPLEITSFNFNQEIFEAEEPILLNFYADWCQPCQVMKSLVSRLAKEHQDSRGKICKINLDSNPQIASIFEIRSVPNLLFIYKKKVHLRQTGLLPYGELSEIWNDFLKDLDEEIIM